MALVAVAALGATLVHARSQNECSAVRAMIDYNEEHNRMLNSTSGFGADDQGTDTEHWADHLEQLSQQISDPKLARHAQAMAELAGQAVSIMSDAHMTAPKPQDVPPQWVSDYADVDQQFRSEVAALAEACPA